MTDPARTLEWREVKPGRWQRDVDEAERFYATLAKAFEGTGRMFFAITGHVSITHEISEDESRDEVSALLDKALGNGWLALRHEHPGIASWVEYDDMTQRLRKVYESSEDPTGLASVSKWLHDTCHFISGYNTGQDWCNSDPPAPRMATLYVIQANPPEDRQHSRLVRRDLVIRSPHDIMDGIGTLTLLGSLLKHTSNAFGQGSQREILTFCDEWRRLSPPLRVAAELSDATSEDVQTRYSEVSASNAVLRDGVEVLTIPFKHGLTTPGKQQRLELKLTSAQTEQIQTACKKLAVTPTHVYHAAAAVALSHIQPPHHSARQARYISYALINLRPQCVPPYNSSSHAASVYHCTSATNLAIDLTVPSHPLDLSSSLNWTNTHRPEFLHILKQVAQFYRSNQSDTDLIKLAPLLLRDKTRAFDWDSPPRDESGNLASPPPNPSPSVSISSMGVIDKIITPTYVGPSGTTRLEVDDPWVTGEELGTGLGLFLGGFRGRLRFSAAFNEAFHDVAEVHDFMIRVQGIVEVGLDVDERRSDIADTN